jgi:hypothetical protein
MIKFMVANTNGALLITGKTTHYMTLQHLLQQAVRLGVSKTSASPKSNREKSVRFAQVTV